MKNKLLKLLTAGAAITVLMLSLAPAAFAQGNAKDDVPPPPCPCKCPMQDFENGEKPDWQMHKLKKEKSELKQLSFEELQAKILEKLGDMEKQITEKLANIVKLDIPAEAKGKIKQDLNARITEISKLAGLVKAATTKEELLKLRPEKDLKMNPGLRKGLRKGWDKMDNGLHKDWFKTPNHGRLKKPLLQPENE